MLDPKLLRKETKHIAKKLRFKGYELDIENLNKLENNL